jgi:hypothetical protein
MSIVLWSLAALAGLVLIVLLSPWHLRLSGTTSPPAARAELRLLAGHAPSIAIPLRPRGPKAPDRKRKRKTSRRRAPPRGTLALLRGILGAFRLRRLTLAGRIGLDDPADTGRLWALIVALSHTLRGPSRRIDLAPDFSGPCLDLEATGEIAVLPLRLIRAGAAFAWANRGAP